MTESHLYRMMEKAVASRCPVSAASNQVGDHVSQCIMRLIHRDALRERILAGTPVTDSHLCTYAVRSAWSDARNSGTNPVCRELFWARTETDRKKKPSEDPTVKVQLDPRLCFARGDFEDVSKVNTGLYFAGNPLPDIVDTPAHEVEDVIFFEENIWGALVEELKRVKPTVYPRYLKVLEVKLKGGGAQQVAKEIDVSRSRATSMIAETRRVLREARASGTFSDYGI